MFKKKLNEYYFILIASTNSTRLLLTSKIKTRGIVIEKGCYMCITCIFLNKSVGNYVDLSVILNSIGYYIGTKGFECHCRY